MAGENGQKVLIVDDAPENIHIMMEMLKGSYVLQAAVNGEKALKLALNDPIPDIILLDIMMPGIDGYEVCRRLKNNSKTKDIPVIFLTAKSETEDIVNGFKAGGVDYVTKPFNMPELTARIKTHLELKASQDRIRQLNRQLAEDLMLAGNLQKELLPAGLDDPRATVRTVYEPYHIVSGDFVSYAWNSDDTKLRGYILDITGHGIATALQISAFNVLLLEAVEKDMPARDMMSWVNDKACNYFHAEYFAAVLYFEFDFACKLMTYVPAGINCFFVFSAQFQGMVNNTSCFIGIDKSQTFEQYTLPFGCGDFFYFVSDGISEFLEDGFELNIGDFEAAVCQLQQITQDNRRWDDASAICVKIGG